MRFLIFSVYPKPNTSEHARYAGADAACWINVKSKETARRKARLMIERQGWVVEKLEEEKLLSRKDYSNASDGLKYFDQAVTDGEVVVFFTSPAEERRD